MMIRLLLSNWTTPPRPQTPGWDETLLTVLLIFAGAAVVVFAVYWLSMKYTGGRGILYKYTQDYGKGHPYTIAALEKCVSKILEKDGTTVDNLSLFHEYGNRYSGTLVTGKKKHAITVYTDGWKVECEVSARRGR